jgi:hypothetical protein
MIRFCSAFALVGLGCSGTTDLVRDVEWERTQVGTVIRVLWGLTEQAETWVEFGPAPDCDGFETPVLNGLDNEVLLLGLPPVTESCFQIKTRVDGEVIASEREPFRTENVPASVEPMEVEAIDPSAYDEGFWVGSNPSGPPMVHIINRKGETVWWHLGSADGVIPQVTLAPNGDGIFFNEFHRNFAIDNSRVAWIGFDGEVKAEFMTSLGHHSYAWLPDGRLAYLVIDVRDTEEYGPVVGDAIWVSDGEEVQEIYTTWDDPHMPLEVHDKWGSNFYPQGIDWTHANFLAFDEDRNSFTISFANADAIVEVDADSGEHLRSVGQAGTHAIAQGLLGRPHAAEWTDSGTLLFFTTPKDTRESRGIELAFDDETLQTEVLWSYGEGLHYNTFIMGAVRQLPNGNTLMNFGSKGILEELTPEDEVVWKAYTATGHFPGHFSFSETLYGQEM